MYWSLIIAKSLYASQSWNTETVACDPKGILTNIITKDNGEMVFYETSAPARKGLSIYKQMFGDWAIMQDIARLKRKGTLKDRMQLPLTPGHIAIHKDLCLIFDILAGDNSLNADDFMVPPPKARNYQTRSHDDTAWIYNTKQKRAHHQQLSIIRRHANLVDYILDCKITMLEVKELKREARNDKLKRIVEQLETEDNKVREEIWSGTYRHQKRPY